MAESSVENDKEGSDDEMPSGLVILSSDEMLVHGLQLLGWENKRLNRRTTATNINQYSGMYGMHPGAVAQLSEDLQTTDIESARMKELSMDKLHWALHFLYRYPTETERESTWKKCANTVRNSTWLYVDKIRNLKHQKIVWPKFLDDDIWVMTVDGTHLVTLEPGNSDVPKDPSYFSFKHHSAGFNYEVGVHLFESKCIWLSGPHKAGTYNDAKMFREKGLKAKLESTGKKAIGDDGYRGFPNTVSTANALDCKEVTEFKTRARQRHEIYNGKLKQFGVLSERFRCKNNPKDKYTMEEKLQMCFEAVNVLVHYKMQHGEPLFDI
jgi:hypothetical protein